MENFRDLYDNNKMIINESIEEKSLSLDFIANIKSKQDSLENRNQHTEAIKVISDSLGYKKISQMLEYVNKIHILYGYMPTALKGLINSIRADLFEYVEREYGLDIAEGFLGSKNFIMNNR